MTEVFSTEVRQTVQQRERRWLDWLGN